MVLLRVVEAHALFEMGVRLGQLAEKKPSCSQSEVGLGGVPGRRDAEPG